MLYREIAILSGPRNRDIHEREGSLRISGGLLPESLSGRLLESHESTGYRVPIGILDDTGKSSRFTLRRRLDHDTGIRS
jgi:hypothetical protein